MATLRQLKPANLFGIQDPRPHRVGQLLLLTVLTTFTLGASSPSAFGQDTHDWNDPSGGIYGTFNNWTPVPFPSLNDTARFNLDATYDVTFIQDRLAAELLVSNGDVTFVGSGILGPDPTYKVNDATIDGGDLTLQNASASRDLHLQVNNSLAVADGLTLRRGAMVSSPEAVIDAAANISVARTLVSGSNSGDPSTLSVSELTVGMNNRSGIIVEDGGRVISHYASLGINPSSSGSVIVRGFGSDASPTTWVTERLALIGAEGRGVFRVENGGSAATESTEIAADATSDSLAVVEGVDRLGNPSVWSMRELIVGAAGTARVEVNAGGYLRNMTTMLARETGSVGEMVVTGDTDFVSTWISSGDVFVGGSDTEAGGEGLLDLNNRDTHVEVAGTLSIWDAGTVTNKGGFLAAGAIDQSKGGDFDFQSGILQTNRFDGILINQGGVLAPGPDAAAMNIFGNYAQQSDATLAIDIGGLDGGDSYDVVNTTGDVELDGQLQLNLIGDFVPAATDVFTVLEADRLDGLFANVSPGQRLTTADGLGSFVVDYGPGSDFDDSEVVLSDFLLAINADFNSDGAMDCRDVDSLVMEIVAGTNTPLFDLTGDENVDPADLTEWLAQAGAHNLPSGNSYLVGDANLDGAVDGQDFLLWNGSKFTETAAWCSGDFNADGSVDGQDFLLWNTNKFTSAAAHTAAVPEPTFGFATLFVLAGAVSLHRRRRSAT